MAAPSKPTELNDFSLKKLEEIESKVVAVLTNAGQTFLELSKDKVNERQLDRYTAGFTSSLEEVNCQLSKQINYLIKVATSQQHEGSTYAARFSTHIDDQVLSQLSTQLENIIQIAEAPVFPSK